VTLSHLLPVLGLGLDLSGLGLRGRGVLILWTASNGSSAYNTDHVRLGDQLAARRGLTITDDMGRCNLQLLTGHLDVKGRCNLQLLAGRLDLMGRCNLQLLTGCLDLMGRCNLQLLMGRLNLMGRCNLQLLTGRLDLMGRYHLQALIGHLGRFNLLSEPSGQC
jgi:hypothetical protein